MCEIILSSPLKTIWAWPRKKTCLRGVAKYTVTDQPAHPRSLISAFVIRFVESFVCKLAKGEISIFKLVPVAEETGLKLTLSETLKTDFLATRPICRMLKIFAMNRIFCTIICHENPYACSYRRKHLLQTSCDINSIYIVLIHTVDQQYVLH